MIDPTISPVRFITGNENAIPYLYWDSGNPAHLTTAIGHVVHAVEDSLSLTWLSSPSVLATPEQVRKDWYAISIAVPGMVASAYESLTVGRLAEYTMSVLLVGDLTRMLPILRRYLSTFDSAPQPAQTAAMDMAYNLGPAFPLTWPKFRRAFLASDWAACAAECHRQGISDQRNDDTRDLLLGAA